MLLLGLLLVVHDRDLVGLGHDLHGRLCPDHAVPPHIGALGALLDGLEEEAGRLAVVLPDEAAVGEHGREVVGEDAAPEGQQVVPRRRRLPERGLLLPHRDGVELLEGGGGATREAAADGEAPVRQRRRRRREAPPRRAARGRRRRRRRRGAQGERDPGGHRSGKGNGG